jgi:hypothetical protein
MFARAGVFMLLTQVLGRDAVDEITDRRYQLVRALIEMRHALFVLLLPIEQPVYPFLRKHVPLQQALVFGVVLFVFRELPFRQGQ